MILSRILGLPIFLRGAFVKHFWGVTYFEHLKGDAVDVAFRHAENASQAFLEAMVDSCIFDHSTGFLTDRYSSRNTQINKHGVFY